MGLLGVVIAALGVHGVVAARTVTGSGPAGVVETAPAPTAAGGLASVRVLPGDTLWAIAMRHAPAGADPRPWIFRTSVLNGLHDANIVPGQVLRLPAGSR